MLRILFCFRLFVFFVKNLFILLLNERKYGSLVCCTVQNDVIYDKNITGMSSSTVSSSSHLADIVSTKTTFISGTVLLDQLALDLGTKVIPLIPFGLPPPRTEEDLTHFIHEHSLFHI